MGKDLRGKELGVGISQRLRSRVYRESVCPCDGRRKRSAKH